MWGTCRSVAALHMELQSMQAAQRARRRHDDISIEMCTGLHTPHASKGTQPEHKRRGGVITKEGSGFQGGTWVRGPPAQAPLMPPSNERSTQGASTWSTPPMTAWVGGIAPASCCSWGDSREEKSTTSNVVRCLPVSWPDWPRPAAMTSPSSLSARKHGLSVLGL